MPEIIENKKKLLVNIAITLCYAIFTLFIVFHHEIWRDEAQVWLILKYSNFPELIRHFINEGHPPFFFMLVMPFVKLNLSIFSMQILCWIFSVFAVFMLFQFSPFKWWLNLSIVLSAGFIYAFPVIARSYSIIPFLIFLLAIFQPKKREHPIIYSVILFLISQTLVIMTGFVAILAAYSIYDCIKNKDYSKGTISGIIISLAGVILTLILAFLATGNNEDLQQDYFGFAFYEVALLFISSVLKTFAISIFGSKLHGSYFSIILFAVLYISLFVQLFRISKKSFIIAFFGIAFQLYVYFNYYPAIYEYKMFCMYLVFVFSFWISINNNNSKDKLIKITGIIMSIFFLYTAPNGLNYCSLDYRMQYSGAKNTAEYIIKNISKDDLIITDIFPSAESIPVYLPEEYKIINTATGEPFKNITWNKNNLHIMKKSEWNEYMKSHDFSPKKVFIIQYDRKFFQIGNGELVYISPPAIIKDERFIIQEYKE